MNFTLVPIALGAAVLLLAFARAIYFIGRRNALREFYRPPEEIMVPAGFLVTLEGVPGYRTEYSATPLKREDTQAGFAGEPIYRKVRK